MMERSDLNPYDSPRTNIASLGNRPLTVWEVFSRIAFIYSVTALVITLLAPLLGMLLLAERFASANMHVINVCLGTIFFSGCVANVVALVFGKAPMKAASVPLAILNVAKLASISEPLWRWIAGPILRWIAN
jgi:hypothetical protein